LTDKLAHASYELTQHFLWMKVSLVIQTGSVVHIKGKMSNFLINTNILAFIGQFDIKYIMMLVLKALTDIITNIPAHPIGLAEILTIMSVSTFKIAVILTDKLAHASYELTQHFLWMKVSLVIQTGSVVHIKGKMSNFLINTNILASICSSKNLE
jgi:hypothetical protein